jgi:hypothetical protein
MECLKRGNEEISLIEKSMMLLGYKKRLPIKLKLQNDLNE